MPTLPATVVIASTTMSGLRKAITRATASSEPQSVSMRKRRTSSCPSLLLHSCASRIVPGQYLFATLSDCSGRPLAGVALPPDRSRGIGIPLLVDDSAHALGMTEQDHLAVHRFQAAQDAAGEVVDLVGAHEPAKVDRCRGAGNPRKGRRRAPRRIYAVENGPH